MDSRLLNIAYDDPFDGNYAKYDNDAEFWSSGSETMGMQLTETLHGILPIAPTDDFHKDDNTTSINIQTSNKNAFNYEAFAGQRLSAGRAIELVTVNPMGGYDTNSEENSDDDDVAAGELEFDRQSQYSNATFRSRTDSSSIGDYESHTSDYDDTDDDDTDDDDTDDDDVDEDEEYDENIMANNVFMQKSQTDVTTNGNNSLIDLHSSLVAPDDLILDNSYHKKSRTFSTTTSSSDVDGFGLQIDANNFDLAEFITKDDFTIQTTTIPPTSTPALSTENNLIEANAKTNILPKNLVLNNVPHTQSVVQVISSKHNDSDSDSDVIVDVETVEIDADNASSLRKASEIHKPTCIETQTPSKPESDVAYVDNVQSDPSWCPAQPAKKFDINKVEEKPPMQKQNFGRNFSIVPSKKQCSILKGKSGKGKAKATLKSTKATTNSAKNTSPLKVENELKKTGIGMGGKNLALLKHKRCSISEHSSEDTPKKHENIIIKPQIKPQIIQQKQQQQMPVNTTKSEKETPAQNDKAQAVKRKLNLEEYKKRRGEPCLITATTANTTTQKTNRKYESYKIPKIAINSINDRQIKTNNTTPTKHSEAVSSIVKTLKEQQNLQLKPITDPITEAKNKVLRMQELKRAQQMRIIDSTISAKVPRVTKLLPLREIVKDTPYLNEEEKKLNSTKFQNSQQDYEEIIIVSTSCNTDISMPPIPNHNIEPVNDASRSLLKSSALLSTISNSFQKVKATDNVKISSSSLISSIQDVVVKKSLPVEEIENGSSKDFPKTAEHYGENKIIMHLRKDRIRKRMCTMATQTELQPEFPPLPLSKTSMKHKSRERTRKQRRRRYRKRHDISQSSSSSEYSLDEHTDTNSSSLTRSRENSCSSSIERIRTYDSAIGTGGYSSRSSRKHSSSISSSYSESADRVARGQRRQRRTSYTKRSFRKRSRSPYSSSSSYSSDSDRSRSPLYRRSSRSRSKSRTRSRSRRPSYRQQSNNNSFLDRNVSQPAVEERRIVYVGRIEQETTKDMLRRKFLPYGTIKQISIHYKDTGMKYGFVTFERSQDAFTAIDTSTRDPQINMYDVSFGGRRAFCRASYADLDNAGINTYQSYVFPQPVQQPREEDSFEALLKKMKAKLNANKPATASTAPAGTAVATNTTNNKI